MSFRKIGLAIAATAAVVTGLSTNVQAFNIDEGVEGYLSLIHI